MDIWVVWLLMSILGFVVVLYLLLGKVTPIGRGVKKKYISIGVLIFIVLFTAISDSIAVSTNTSSLHNTSAHDKGDVGWIVYPLVVIGIFVVVIIISFATYYTGKGYYQKQINKLVSEGQEIEQHILERQYSNVHDVIKQVFSETKNYYALVRTQTVFSFIIGISTIITGLVLVTIAIVSAIILKSPNMTINLIAGIAGIIFNIVGGSVFLFHRNAAKRMDEYFKKLDETKNLVWAISLIESYIDSQSQQQEICKVLDRLLEKRSS